MIVGFILEANPYHNGHRHLLSKAKQKFPNATFVAVTSTSFTMRGEISLLNKFDKTKILLNEGIDIVLELPISSTLQGADYFAKNTIFTLYNAGVTDIIVGCETDDIKYIELFYNLLNSNDFKHHFKTNLSLHLGYKKIYEKTLIDLGITPDLVELFNSPNMTLSLCYYKIIRENNLPINLHLIKRTNEYYQNEHNDQNIASASFIRNLYQKEQDFCHYLPYEPHFINLGAFETNFIKVINFQMISQTDQDINGNSEGILNFILQNGVFTSNYNTLIESLNNKKYSTSRLRRVLISYLLSIKKGYESPENYLRILGISQKGMNHLSTLSKQTKQIIFSNPNELKKIYDENIQTIFTYEISSTKLYGILSEQPDLYLNEYQLPIKKEGN